MEIRAEVKYPVEISGASPEFAALSEDDQREYLFAVLTGLVMEAATEELKLRGLKPKRRIKQPGGDRQKESGTELLVNDLGEHHATFSVAFEGDHDAAVEATARWVERVETFGGIAGIGHASLRGTDGTNLHAFSDEIEAAVADLDEDTRAWADELMDPNRRGDV